MKKLFPPGLLPNLLNLEVIDVQNGSSMEEILMTEDEGFTNGESNSRSNNALIVLPKLRLLTLLVLPELKSICCGKMICNSLQENDISNCPKIKRMSFYLPLLDNDQSSHPHSLKTISIRKGWWEILEWDHPNVKDILQPFVAFYSDDEDEDEYEDEDEMGGDEDGDENEMFEEEDEDEDEDEDKTDGGEDEDENEMYEEEEEEEEEIR